MSINVRIKLSRGMTAPEYATDGSAAVDLRAALEEGEVVTLLPQSLDVGDDIGMGGADGGLLQGGEAQLGEAGQGLGMSSGFTAVEVQASLLEVEHEDGEGALGGDIGVELAQRPGGGVTGIGQEGRSLGLSLGVEAEPPGKHIK